MAGQGGAARAGECLSQDNERGGAPQRRASQAIHYAPCGCWPGVERCPGRDQNTPQTARRSNRHNAASHPSEFLLPALSSSLFFLTSSFFLLSSYFFRFPSSLFIFVPLFLPSFPASSSPPLPRLSPDQRPPLPPPADAFPDLWGLVHRPCGPYTVWPTDRPPNRLRRTHDRPTRTDRPP